MTGPKATQATSWCHPRLACFRTRPLINGRSWALTLVRWRGSTAPPRSRSAAHDRYGRKGVDADSVPAKYQGASRKHRSTAPALLTTSTAPGGAASSRWPATPRGRQHHAVSSTTRPAASRWLQVPTAPIEQSPVGRGRRSSSPCSGIQLRDCRAPTASGHRHPRRSSRSDSTLTPTVCPRAMLG